MKSSFSKMLMGIDIEGISIIVFVRVLNMLHYVVQGKSSLFRFSQNKTLNLSDKPNILNLILTKLILKEIKIHPVNLIGTSGWHCSRSPFRRLTGNKVSGPLFSQLIFLLLFSPSQLISHRLDPWIKKLVLLKLFATILSGPCQLFWIPPVAILVTCSQ